MQGDQLTRGAAFAKEAAKLLPLECSRPSLTALQGLTALVVYDGCLGELQTTLGNIDRFYNIYNLIDQELQDRQWLPTVPGSREDKVAHALSYIHWGFYVYEW